MNKYFVIDNRHITDSTLLLTFKKGPNTKPISFQPGQYAVISFRQNGRPTPARCFSIVNSPTEHGIIQCSIRKKGRFTNAAAGLRVGDEVNISGPFGGFVFDERYDRKIVLIAGGIGITPFMSMIQYATKNKLTNEITLIYNNSNQNDIPFVEQLIDIEKHNPHFNIVFTISNGPIDRFDDQNMKAGRITNNIINDAVKGIYGDKTFFVCGPSAFMNAMTDILFENGVSEEKVMTEAFGHGSGRKIEKTHSWPRKVYTFGVVGVVLATTAVMVSDLFTNLPIRSLFNFSNQEDQNSTNSRQDELDNQINGTSSGQPTSTQTTVNSSTSNSKSAPVCTTTQSGVTTCV
jgi:ferredoxin-NADP reductase